VSCVGTSSDERDDPNESTARSTTDADSPEGVKGDCVSRADAAGRRDAKEAAFSEVAVAELTEPVGGTFSPLTEVVCPDDAV
jgi:hypothetical protein